MVTPEFLQFALVFALTPNSVLGKIDVLKEATIKTPGPEVLVTVALLTFLKEDEGPPAHIFSGPITGYVLEGEFLFQVRNGPIHILTPEEKFHEEEGTVFIWGGNASNSTVCKVLVSVFGKMGEPIQTPLQNYPRENYADAIKMATRSN